jgi:hypothetical protein
VLVASVVAAQTTGEPKPPNVYIDKGACPFESCTYREWIARTDVTLLDSPNGKKVVGRIKKGERVLALTGEVHSVPLRVIAQHDDSDAGVKVGDTIYILHYEGEGYYKVWHDGKVVDVENFSDKAAQPKATWWVKLKHAPALLVGPWNTATLETKTHADRYAARNYQGGRTSCNGAGTKRIWICSKYVDASIAASRWVTTI